MKTRQLFAKSRYTLFNNFTFIVLFILITLSACAQSNYATKLGYPADTKLLIIHADDLGMSHSINIASFDAIKNSPINSSSVMMAAPWVLEVVNYVKENEAKLDLGLHLVYSSEWKNYKMGPVSPVDKVPSMVNKHGYFHSYLKSTVNPKELEIEFRAQIERAYAMGLNPSHLDVHMAGLNQYDKLYEVYLKLGKEYKLPIRVSKDVAKEKKELIKKYDVKIILDELFGLNEKQFAEGGEKYYLDFIKNLKPGLSLLIVHTGHDNEEMKGMTVEHPNWGSEWREKDLEFFNSEACKKALEKENIKLVTWKQLKDALYK